MKYRTWRGEFRITQRTSAARDAVDARGLTADWVIKGAASQGRGAGDATFFIAGVESDEAPPIRFDTISIEWHADGVIVSLPGAAPIRARSAMVHEPKPELYAVLPLPRFAESQRRFWWRVFRLVRIPGGRWLLTRLARRSRA
jgi:hypothetical protein